MDTVQVFVVSSFWAHNTVPFSTTFCSAIKDPAVEKRLDWMAERTIQEAMWKKLKEVDESRKRRSTSLAWVSQGRKLYSRLFTTRQSMSGRSGAYR